MNNKKTPKHSNSIESRNISEIAPDTDIQVEKVLEENEQLKELLEQKEKLIYQLTNENLRLQEQYNLITSNIIEKGSVVSMLDRISARLNEVEKNQTVKETSFAEILKQRPTNLLYCHTLDYLKLCHRTHHYRKATNNFCPKFLEEKDGINILPAQHFRFRKERSTERQTTRPIEGGASWSVKDQSSSITLLVLQRFLIKFNM
nr:unnamed protein product [Callosobruchus analis]